jgi:PemK-like, MazF-like toxin of type II toxin-antitoxin system
VAMNLSARVARITPATPTICHVTDGIGGSLGRTLLRALTAGATAAARSLLRSPNRRSAGSPSGPVTDDSPDDYPGDFTGVATIEYRPDPNGAADPGEVVWSWVPYEEDHHHGKDRPVLVIGRDGRWLLGLMLTSKDHDRDAAQEARAGRHWMDVGAGGWDAQHRPSEARLDRVLRLDPAVVRREGATLDRRVFDAVAEQVRAVNGWA